MGGWVATKWRAKATSSLKTAKWHPLVSFAPPHITQRNLIHGQTHQLIVWRFIAGWLLVHWRWSHLKITPALVDVWQDSETSHSKSSLGNFQHWYLADMLASVYSYCVMVKSISSCCVRGRWVLSNPVTYVIRVVQLFVSSCCHHPPYPPPFQPTYPVIVAMCAGSNWFSYSSKIIMQKSLKFCVYVCLYVSMYIHAYVICVFIRKQVRESSQKHFIQPYHEISIAYIVKLI